jgi:hypothetical protein
LIAQATDSLTQVIKWLAVGSHARSLDDRFQGQWS